MTEEERETKKVAILVNDFLEILGAHDAHPVVAVQALNIVIAHCFASLEPEDKNMSIPASQILKAFLEALAINFNAMKNDKNFLDKLIGNK